jgi:ParB-like chromosome segregation protein Spo0J
MTETQKREHVLKLNMARRHLEPHERGGLYKRLLEERGLKRGRGKDNPPLVCFAF